MEGLESSTRMTLLQSRRQSNYSTAIDGRIFARLDFPYYLSADSREWYIRGMGKMQLPTAQWKRSGLADKRIIIHVSAREQVGGLGEKLSQSCLNGGYVSRKRCGIIHTFLQRTIIHKLHKNKYSMNLTFWEGDI